MSGHNLGFAVTIEIARGQKRGITPGGETKWAGRVVGLIGRLHESPVAIPDQQRDGVVVQPIDCDVCLAVSVKICGHDRFWSGVDLVGASRSETAVAVTPQNEYLAVPKMRYCQINFAASKIGCGDGVTAISSAQLLWRRRHRKCAVPIA